MVAILEIVSPGNKDSRHAIQEFARKAVEFLHAGVNLLIVDLFPPGRRDSQGVHKVIWDRLQDEPFSLPPDKPLTVAAYAVGAETVAYVEPVAVGDRLAGHADFPDRRSLRRLPTGGDLPDGLAAVSRALRGPLESPPTPM